MAPPIPPVRLRPDRPFPPYSYVSGFFPHPTRDPLGHSFGVHEPPCSLPELMNWQRCATYLYAIDLFNHGYYWEAHEAWEGLWLACGRRGTTADFLKGLIKLAAAGVKAREGNTSGVARHAARAWELFGGVQAALTSSEAAFLGLTVSKLLDDAEQLRTAPDRIVNTSAEPVVVVMPFRLIPNL